MIHEQETEGLVYICVCVCGGREGRPWEGVDKDHFTEICTVDSSSCICLYVINQAFKCEFLAEQWMLQSSNECRKWLNLVWGGGIASRGLQVWNNIDISSKGYCNSWCHHGCDSDSANVGGCVQIFTGLLSWGLERDDYIWRNHIVLISRVYSFFFW